MEFVTLHVGLGTFQGVKENKIMDHVMHSEFFELDESTANRLNKAKEQGKRIIAVGTTTVRVLETCAEDRLPKAPCHFLKARTGETDIFIYPGYEWRFVEGIITNFHLPKSTLLMLVSSFASFGHLNADSLLSGRDFILQAYQEAIKEKYRFFSFGDAMMIA